jgi:histidine ammonia-lyase
MGTISARKAREVVANTWDVIAIELLCAAQALDLFTNIKPGEGSLAAYQNIREAIPPLEKDRVLSEDIRTLKTIMHSGEIVASVESAVGVLQSH